MNLTEFMNIFSDVEIIGEKIFLTKDIAKAVEFVKQNYKFDMLKEIIAIDLEDKGIELDYCLYSIENEENLVLSIVVKDEAESISHIFDSAIADENEIFDLFGINFTGHSNLKRLYMPEGWKGNPLKKEYSEDDERLRWND